MTEPSTQPRARAWVEIQLAALCANAERLLEVAAPATALLPMVKADAYGLGAVRVSAALATALPRRAIGGFGVAAVAEAEELREAGWQGRIVVFSPLSSADYRRAAEAELTLSLSSLEAVKNWAATAQSANRLLPFHIEIDTGMGRSGFPASDVRAWAPEVAKRAAGRLRWEGSFTHFHSADAEDLRPTTEQWTRFSGAVDTLSTMVDTDAMLFHAANSAAALRCSLPADLVRPGIFLYGGRVGAESPRSVVSVRARIVLVRNVTVGSTVGYGATYRARQNGERWATLAIGYGDGIPRALSVTGGEVLIAGRRVPIVGRLSMDTTVVDVTTVPGVEVDHVATLIGEDGVDEISVDEVAQRAGTISYEILTGLTRRLPRIYRGPRSLVQARLG